ncbi:hypothetical protein [Salinisphaera sp. SPP-AMP-43]|uniref:hypothetical protein n=1 Tax=Salinisphaera sp. SPP-AMP-43 TaxID=3121288 RepID=UPI003C6E7A41
MIGAVRGIAIDRAPERLKLANDKAGAEVINFEQDDVYRTLLEMPGGRGPDCGIDCIGAEAHPQGDPEYVRRSADSSADNHPLAVNEMITSVRKSGHTHMRQYLKPRLNTVEQRLIDPSFIIPPRYHLADAATPYARFNAKQDGCINVVMPA